MRQLLIAAGLGSVIACGGERGPDAAGYGQLRLTQDGACTLVPPAGPGLTEVTFVNATDDVHRAAVVRLVDSTTDSTLLAWYSTSRSVPPAGTEWIGGPGPTPPGSSSVVTLRLSPGRHAAICLPGDSDSGEVLVLPALFLVDSLLPPAGLEPPLTDAILQVWDDSVEWIPAPSPGRRIIRVANRGAGNNTVLLLRADDSTKTTPLGGISDLGPGREGWIAITLQPGLHRVVVVGRFRDAPRVVANFEIK